MNLAAIDVDGVVTADGRENGFSSKFSPRLLKNSTLENGPEKLN